MMSKPVSKPVSKPIYKKVGGGSLAQSTLNGYKYAIRHFDIYRASVGMSSYFESTEEDLCDIEKLQEFGGYLCEHARDQNGDLISQGSAAQFLSGVRTSLCLRFKKNSAIRVSLTVYKFIKSESLVLLHFRMRNNILQFIMEY